MSDGECRCGHGIGWHRESGRCELCKCEQYQEAEEKSNGS